jgi:hypothetical protein
MIKRMVASENEQLLCTVNQLIEGIGRGAAGQDWANFARRYNGPNYAINNYDLRLSAAYQKFSYGARRTCESAWRKPTSRTWAGTPAPSTASSASRPGTQ